MYQLALLTVLRMAKRRNKKRLDVRKFFASNDFENNNNLKSYQTHAEDSLFVTLLSKPLHLIAHRSVAMS